MPDWYKLARLALSPPVTFTLFVAGVLLLLVPLPVFLRIQQIRDQYGPYIGVATVTALAASLVAAARWVAKQVAENLGRWWARRAVLSNLQSLSPEEQGILQRAQRENVRTLYLRSACDEVSALVAKGLLDEVPHNSHYESKPYTIPLHVWKHLKVRPNIQ